MSKELGISGRIAAFFQTAQITPLLALAALLLGAFAVLVTPREEEPQINVTMANVLIPFPGASARDVEQMVAAPAEQVLSQIAGIEHVMSVSRPGLAVMTVQFKVGVPRIEALVRLYDTVNANADWLPKGLGVLPPLIKPKGIDDVPIVTLTLYSRNPAIGAFDLERVAHSIEADLKRVGGTREVTTIGGPGRAVHGRDRSEPDGGQRRDGLRPARFAAVGQPRPAGGRSSLRESRRRRRIRPVPQGCPRRGRAGRGCARRQARLPAGRGHGARRPAAGEPLRLARRRRQGRRRVPGRHHRRDQEARRERHRRRERGDAPRRPAPQYRHPAGRSRSPRPATTARPPTTRRRSSSRSCCSPPPRSWRSCSSRSAGAKPPSSARP